MNGSSLPQVPSLQRAAARLSRLPGIGPRTAERIAFHLLRLPREEVLNLTHALREVIEKVRTCSVCYTLTEEDPCVICSDSNRDQSVLCVVQDCQDVQAIERTRTFRGRYHVLGGVLSPMNGVGPDELTIAGLMKRLDGVEEVILATNPTVEGEATAIYLTRLLKDKGVQVSKMARGLPMGGNMEFIDEVTLGEALKGRQQI